MKNAPLYPFALDETVDVTVEYNTAQTITQFTTADSAGEVLAFYKKIMAKEGWILYEEGLDRVAFDYRGSTDDGGTYNFIVMVASDSHLTRITLIQNRDGSG